MRARNSLLFVTLLAACSGGADSGGGGNRVTIDISNSTFTPKATVDILFVLDNGNTGTAVNAQFQEGLGSFVTALQDLTVAGRGLDTHIGVITTDFGAGATGAPGCTPSPGGDGGRLQAIGRDAVFTCKKPTDTNFVRYDFANSSSNNLPLGRSLVDTLKCMSSVGNGGCGFRHPLAAAYAALHNQLPENVGFLRDDANLLVVFVTPRDDCSASSSASVFEKTTRTFGYESTYRCAHFGLQCGSPPMSLPYGSSNGPLTGCVPMPNPEDSTDKLADVQKYIDFFTKPASGGGIKTDPSAVMLAAITGPAQPVKVILTDPGTPLGQPYIECPALDEVSDPACTPMLAHACDSQSDPNLFGDPAVRLLAVVNAASHVTASSCDDSYAPSLRDMAMRLAAAGDAVACVEFPLPLQNGNPVVHCDVKDTASDGSTTSIPACSEPPSSYPCYRVAADPQCASAPQGLGIHVLRNGAAPAPGTSTTASCVAAAGVDGGGGGGGVDWVSYCNRNCDKLAECSSGAFTADQCKQMAKCASYSPVAGACKNLNEIFSCFEACLDKSCTEIGTCATKCPTCR